MKSKIAAVCTAVLLGLGLALNVSPAHADEAPPPEVVVSETAPVDEAPPADPVPPEEEVPAPMVEDTPAPEVVPDPEPEEIISGGASSASIASFSVYSDTVWVYWLVPAGVVPVNNAVGANGFPQNYLPNGEADAPPCRYIQVDKYLASEAPGFYADGVLMYKEDWGDSNQTGAISWYFIDTGCTAKVDFGITLATCTTGQTLVEGETTNATWDDSAAAAWGLEGPASYSISATATPGATGDQFVNGVAQFEGTLAGPDKSLCEQITPTPPGFEDICVQKGDDGPGWIVTGAEDTATIDWTVEVDTASMRVRVIAVAIDPAVLASGEDKDVWKFDYTDIKCVTPKPPKFHDECGTSCDWFKIPGHYNGENQWNSYHGYYTVQDNRVDGVGQVKVVFHPNQDVEVNEPGDGDSYHLYHGNAVWKFEFTAIDCVIEGEPGVVTFHDECGTDKDTVTVPEVPEGAHWEYVVTDNRVNGVGTVTVEAVADDEWAFPEGVTTSWSHDFTNVACPVTTTGLANTGGVDLRLPAGALAAGMVLAGLVLTVRRRLAAQ